MRLPRERFDYTPIVSRRRWKLPKKARIAVWTIVNIEEWDIEKPIIRQYLTAPQGVLTVPDVPNWAWHDYGMRVGFWRLLDALTKRRILATTAINAGSAVRAGPTVRANSSRPKIGALLRTTGSFGAAARSSSPAQVPPSANSTASDASAAMQNAIATHVMRKIVCRTTAPL